MIMNISDVTVGIVEHPFNSKHNIKPDTEILIMGTAPPYRPGSKPNPSDVDFYYGSRDNQLWSCIFPDIFDDFPETTSPPDVFLPELLAFLAEKNIWTTDILEKYSRRKPNSSSDSTLVPHQLTSIKSVLTSAKRLQKIILMGGTTERLFRQRMAQEFESAPPLPKTPMPRDYGPQNFPDHDYTIRICTVASSSPQAERVYGLETRKQMYRSVLKPDSGYKQM